MRLTSNHDVVTLKVTSHTGIISSRRQIGVMRVHECRIFSQVNHLPSRENIMRKTTLANSQLTLHWLLPSYNPHQGLINVESISYMETLSREAIDDIQLQYSRRSLMRATGIDSKEMSKSLKSWMSCGKRR